MVERDLKVRSTVGWVPKVTCRETDKTELEARRFTTKKKMGLLDKYLFLVGQQSSLTERKVKHRTVSESAEKVIAAFETRHKNRPRDYLWRGELIVSGETNQNLFHGKISLPPPRHSRLISSRLGSLKMRAVISVHRPTATIVALLLLSLRGVTSKQATSCSNVVWLQTQNTKMRLTHYPPMAKMAQYPPVNF